MWCLGTWFSGGLGSVTLMVGLDDLKGLFQPKRFYDSVRGTAGSARELDSSFQCCGLGFDCTALCRLF